MNWISLSLSLTFNSEQSLITLLFSLIHSIAKVEYLTRDDVVVIFGLN